MSIKAFEEWFGNGLPNGYFKKNVVRDFGNNLTAPLFHFEDDEVSVLERLASSSSPEAIVEECLFFRNFRRTLVCNWHANDVLPAIGLQLACLGVSTQYELRYLYYRNVRGDAIYQSYTLMRLVSDANLNHILVQHPGFDLSVLLARIKVAIEKGSFHARWTKGLIVNEDFPVPSDGIDSRHDLPSYASAVIYAHYSGASLPPDLSDSITAESVRALICFDEAVDWRPAYAALVDEKKKIDFNQAYIFDHLLSQAAPLAKHAGVDPRIIARQCSQMMDEYRDEQSNRPDAILSDAYKRVMLMNILWDRPDLWAEHGLEAADLLGVPYTALHEGENYYNTLWRDSMIGKNHSGSTLGDRMLIPLGKRYPELYDPRNIARKWGTCTAKWFKGVKDFEPAKDIINDLMSRNIWHYALESEKLSHLFGEQASLCALMTFLRSGGNANRIRAEKAMAQHPEIINQALIKITSATQIKRLATIHHLSSEQLQPLPGKLRDAVFSVNLGI